MQLSNVPFRIECAVMRFGMQVFGLRPSSDPFLSGDSFRALANLLYEDGALTGEKPTDGFAPVVFVQSSEVKDFLRRISGTIGGPYVLVSNNGDEDVHESHVKMLDDNVMHWFAHNLLARHEKVTCIPIGLENARFHCNGIVSDFLSLRKHLPSVAKTPRVLGAFTVGNNPRERCAARDALQQSKVGTMMGRTNSREYRRRLVQYMFVASPPGNGFDCHRTWEALYLGVVPVVKRHPFFEQFPPELPLLQLNEWSDLESYSEEKLAATYRALEKGFDRVPMLWMDYWKKRIEASRRGANG